MQDKLTRFNLLVGGRYRHPLMAGGTRQTVLPTSVGGYRVDILRFMAACMFIVGSILAIQNLHYNQQAEFEAEQALQASYDAQNNGGGDNGAQPPNIVPTTNRPTREQVLAYQVAPHLPKRIEIPAIDVFARITVVGNNAEGEVGVPEDVFDSSWYKYSSDVGEEPGSSVIVGHVGFRSIAGVFHDIDRLQPGDTITVTMGDNRQFTYIVRSLQDVSLSTFSMSDYLSFHNEPDGLLHIMTCSGAIIPGTHDFDSRMVVTASLI